MFLGETQASEEVIALALKKCSLSVEEAICMVITEEGIAELQAELVKDQEEKQDSNVMIIAKDAPKADADMENDEQLLEDKLNLIVSNKAEYFDLLFDLLNLGAPEITQAVWKLMMQVPINQKLFNSMRSLQSIRVDSPIQASHGSDQHLLAPDDSAGWHSIIDPNSPYKMLYSLQILNTLVSVNNQVLSDVEVQERYEWRQRFLELGGFTHLYEILITSDISEMIAPNGSSNAQANQAEQSRKLGHQQLQ